MSAAPTTTSPIVLCHARPFRPSLGNTSDATHPPCPCPGFEPNVFKPTHCRSCTHARAVHTLLALDEDGDADSESSSLPGSRAASPRPIPSATVERVNSLFPPPALRTRTRSGSGSSLARERSLHRLPSSYDFVRSATSSSNTSGAGFILSPGSCGPNWDTPTSPASPRAPTTSSFRSVSASSFVDDDVDAAGADMPTLGSSSDVERRARNLISALPMTTEDWDGKPAPAAAQSIRDGDLPAFNDWLLNSTHVALESACDDETGASLLSLALEPSDQEHVSEARQTMRDALIKGGAHLKEASDRDVQLITASAVAGDAQRLDFLVSLFDTATPRIFRNALWACMPLFDQDFDPDRPGDRGLQWLLQSQPDLIASQHPTERYTPLGRATVFGQSTLVHALLGWGASLVDPCDQQHRTPLEIAVGASDVEVLAALLQRLGELENTHNPPAVNIEALLQHALQNSVSPGVVEALVRHKPAVLVSSFVVDGETLPVLSVAILALHRDLRPAEQERALRAIDMLISHDVDLNQPSSAGRVPLLLALQSSTIECAFLLLWSGASVDNAVLDNLAEEQSQRLMLLAIVARPEIVPHLAARISVDFELNGRTPLTVATSHGRHMLVRVLLAHGASYSLADGEGNTALCVAAESGDCACLSELLKLHGDASEEELCINTPGRDGLTPLMLAATQGHQSIVYRLREQQSCDLDVQHTDTGKTALMLAVEYGRASMVGFLLSDMQGRHADAGKRDANGYTALLLACLGCNPRVVARLGRSVSPEVLQMRLPDNRGPVRLAAERDDEALMASLLESTTIDLDVNERDADGVTPLMVAVAGRSFAVVRLLTQAGASPAPVTLRHHLASALHSAADARHAEAVQLLVQDDQVDINAQDWHRDTALHRAARRGARTIVDILLAHGADPTISNTAQQTAAHVASTEFLARLIRSYPLRASLTEFLLPIHLAPRSGTAPDNALKRFACHDTFDRNLVTLEILPFLTGHHICNL